MAEITARPTEIAYGPGRRRAAVLEIFEGANETYYTVKSRKEEVQCDDRETAERVARHLAEAATEYVEAVSTAEGKWRDAIQEVAAMSGTTAPVLG